MKPHVVGNTVYFPSGRYVTFPGNQEAVCEVFAALVAMPFPEDRNPPAGPVTPEDRRHAIYIRDRANLPKLSSEAQAARRPHPPEELVDALQDRIHKEAL